MPSKPKSKQKTPAKKSLPRRPFVQKFASPGTYPERRPYGKMLTSAAIVARKERDKLGIKPVEVSFKIPPRLQLALQVREKSDLPWGTIKGFNINQFTPDREFNEYHEQLAKLKADWVMNGYFGPNASFRIGKVKTVVQEVKY